MHTRAWLFRILRIAVVVSVIAPPCAAEFADQKTSARKALTVRQLEILIQKKSPDNVIGQELRGRGLASPADWPLIERLKKLGAGPETVAALQHLLPKVRLVVRTAPGASVALEGTPVATVGEAGELVLEVQPGNYQLLVSLKDHTSFSKPIRLALNQPLDVEAPLQWKIGFLTLDAGIPEAQIAIAGAGQHAGRVENLPLAVGPHEIRVTAPFRQGFSTVVAIEGGKTHVIPVKLELDEVALKAAGSEILEAYSKNDFAGAIRKSPPYLQRGGADPETLKVLALSYYHERWFDAFAPIAAKALAAGAELTFNVRHYHSAFTMRGDHDAELGISTFQVRFMPVGKCNLGSMTIPTKVVRGALRSTGESSTLILTVPNPKNPAKTIDINLVDAAPTQLEVILRVLETAAQPTPAQ